MSEPILATKLRELQLAFPEKQLPQETIRLYARELGDVPPDLLAAAVQEIIRSHDRFPRIAEVRRCAAERLLKLPSEAQALAQIEARIACGRGQEQTPVAPLVKAALDQIGGFAGWRMTDAPGIVRSQFLNVYRDLRAQAVAEVVVQGFRKGIESGLVDLAADRTGS